MKNKKIKITLLVGTLLVASYLFAFNDSFRDRFIPTNHSQTVDKEVVLRNYQHWLDDETIEYFQKRMKIDSYDVPSDFGDTYLAAWFNSENNVQYSDFKIPNTNTNGEKIALGFKNYHNERTAWGSFVVEYSTYDFATPTEYETYATKSDYEKIKSGEYQDVIVIDGVKGIVNKTFEFKFGNYYASKSAIFPFNDYYISVTYYLDTSSIAGEPDDSYSQKREQFENDFYNDVYSTQDEKNIKALDNFVQSLRFSDIQ